MDAMKLYARLEVPPLKINHCSDVSCSHPSCWASRKLFKRNAYLLMLKGIPASESRIEEDLPERKVVIHREIPTQKVHNIVNELFRNASDPDGEWFQQPCGGVARGISAGQMSIKHMPTPMSSLSRNASKLRQSVEPGAYGTEYEGEEKEAETESARKIRKPVVGQVSMQDMFQPNDQHSVYQTREYVWVPNPNRKPRVPLRRSDQPDSVGLVNINTELGHYLQEDNYNQRQAALQERAVERSHLSTARVQRFFKSMAPTTSTKHVDLFKLPSDLLSEVLRNVDQGEPMTDESLARMVEQAEAPAGISGQVSGGGSAPAAVGSDFERHVLRQRRAQLHNSEARLARQPMASTSRPPVFLTDNSAAAAAAAAPTPSPTGGRQRLPPIPVKHQPQAARQQKAAPGPAATVTVTGSFDRRPVKRSLGADCQLMLGPVKAGDSPHHLAAEAAAAAPSAMSGRDDDGACSMDVECRSDRSTLLDEVLPTRVPGRRDSGLTGLLAMNRPSYDLDDPWADLAEGPHTTTRNESMLMTSSAPTTALEPRGISMPLTPQNQFDDDDEGEGGGDGEGAGEVGNEEEEEDNGTARREGGHHTTPAPTARASPGPPPPSPDVESAGAGRAASPPPSARRSSEGAGLPHAKSAASSSQMPPLTEDDEADA